MEIDGLLLAGRNISGTHKAHSSFRVMPICVNLGQAAGIAAALAARSGIAPRQVSARDVQRVLTENGVTVQSGNIMNSKAHAVYELTDAEEQ